MNGAMQILKQFISISQTQNNHMATLWQFGIKPVQQPKNIRLELSRLSFFSCIASTNIISDELQKEKHWMISGLISLQSFNVTPGISWVSTVYSDVLKIIVVADIDFSQFFVDGVRRVAGLSMCSVSGLMR